MMNRFIAHNMPKIELHCHLDGSVSLPLIQKLMQQEGKEPLGLEELREKLKRTGQVSGSAFCTCIFHGAGAFGPGNLRERPGWPEKSRRKSGHPDRDDCLHHAQSGNRKKYCHVKRSAGISRKRCCCL